MQEFFATELGRKIIFGAVGALIYVIAELYRAVTSAPVSKMLERPQLVVVTSLLALLAGALLVAFVIPPGSIEGAIMAGLAIPRAFAFVLGRGPRE
jgi:hypothetical protein